MFRTLFFLSLVVLSFELQAQCLTAVDPTKVMLFIDTNRSDLEIDTAQKAACARGEKLVVVPKNYKEYTAYSTATEKASKRYRNCLNTKGYNSCQNEDKLLQEQQKLFENFKEKQPNLKEATNLTLQEIKASNAKMQNLLISGHDGGGSYGGDKGSLSRWELGDLMKDYPEINDVKSLMLLGCYTGVQKEIIEWKNIFPEAKLIAGYDGSAPLSDKPRGHQYITEILGKEKELIAQSDQKKLQAYTKANITSLTQLNAAIYVECAEDQEFYYDSKNKGRNFSNFDIKECLEKGPEIQLLIEKVAKYESGEIEPPADTAGGELRQLYNQGRALEHCGDLLDSELNLNNIFNLLFYEGVKKSFASYYKDDLAKVEKILAAINLEEIEKNLNENLAEKEKIILEEQSELELLNNDPEAYISLKLKQSEELKQEMKKLQAAHPFLKDQWAAPVNEKQTEIWNQYNILAQKQSVAEYRSGLAKSDLNGVVDIATNTISYEKQAIENHRSTFNRFKQDPKKINELWVPTSENLSKKSRKELLQNLHNIHDLMNLPGYTKEQNKALNWTSQVTSNHLQYFQNPFSWHEHSGGSTEAPSWPIKYDGFNFY